MAGTVALLFLKPQSLPFALVYLACGLSDLLDGPVARRMGTESKRGALFDSVADLLFFVVVVAKVSPLLVIPLWMWYALGLVVGVKMATVIIGVRKYHTLPFLHTWLEKATGFLLFLLPLFLPMLSFSLMASFLLAVAFLGAAEELAITIRSKALDRDVGGWFSRGR